jgi:glycosyltransferase involved in cell wall biosynthesis
VSDVAGPVAEVAVVMPHRDGAAYLGQSVRSILSQEKVSLRLYLVDDASTTDEWLAAIEPWRADPRLVALRTGRHVGPFRITNWVLQHSQEPFIAFQDADDWSAPNRLRLQLDALKRGRADILGSAYFVVDEDGRPLRLKTMPRNVNLAQFFGRYGILHSSTMMSRAALGVLHGFDGADPGVGADSEFYLRATFACRMRNLPQPLYYYRQHGSSLTNAAATGDGSQARDRYELAINDQHRKRRKAWLLGMMSLRRVRSESLEPRANDVAFDVREARLGATGA